MNGLFMHYMDAVQVSARHHPRLRRSPSLRRHKWRGYAITALVFLTAVTLAVIGVLES